jgi:hypothetical protein
MEQHCVAHREDLGLDDAWKNVSLMKDIETLVRTVYTMFSRSSVKKNKFEALCDAANCEAVSFRPLHEVRWLSRHFAVRALMRNYKALIQHCKDQVEQDNDPIHKYCLDKLTKPQYHVSIAILDDVLGELAELCRLLQRSTLTTIEAYQLTKAKIRKLTQYLGTTAHFSSDVQEIITSYEVPVDTAAVIRFVERVCDHLDSRFPEDELKEWYVFDKDSFLSVPNLEEFTFGKLQLETLAARYSSLLDKKQDIFAKDVFNQYVDFKLTVSEKIKTGGMKDFEDIISYTLQQGHFREISFLLDICGTFQASSADCERGFSLMNQIKTKARNRLEVDHLDNIMRIKFYLVSGNIVNLDHVYTFWRNDKGRRAVPITHQ